MAHPTRRPSPSPSPGGCPNGHRMPLRLPLASSRRLSSAFRTASADIVARLEQTLPTDPSGCTQGGPPSFSCTNPSGLLCRQRNLRKRRGNRHLFLFQHTRNKAHRVLGTPPKGPVPTVPNVFQTELCPVSQ